EGGVRCGGWGSVGDGAVRIDDDVVTGHHPGQVQRLIHNAASHAQVWRARELGLVSHHRGDLVTARKRCSENALAGVAGGAEEKDFHNRTSKFDLSPPRVRYCRLPQSSSRFPPTVRVLCRSAFGAIAAPTGKFRGWS